MSSHGFTAKWLALFLTFKYQCTDAERATILRFIRAIDEDEHGK